MPGTAPKKTPANIARVLCGVLALIPPAIMAGLPPWLSAILAGIGGACLYFTDREDDPSDPPPASGKAARDAWRDGLRAGLVLPVALLAALPLVASCGGAQAPVSASHGESSATVTVEDDGRIELDAVSQWELCAEVRGAPLCTTLTPSVYWRSGEPVALCLHHPLIPVAYRCVEIPADGEGGGGDE